MEENRLEMNIEALLLVSRTPLSLQAISKAVGVEQKTVKEAIERLCEFYKTRGINLEEVAGGWQLRTNPKCAETIQKFLQAKPIKLTKQALETLSMIAYMQPVTKAKIEEIRGVDTSHIIKFLIEHGFIRIIGQKEVPGRPYLYGTTKFFLEFFGLKSLSDLPRLQEEIELKGEDMENLSEPEETTQEEENKDSKFFEEISSIIEEMKKT